MNIKKFLFSAFVVFGMARPDAVIAQSENSIEPVSPSVISPGGVDMRSGAYQYRSTDAAVGPADESGGFRLVRSRTRVDSGSNSTPHNLVWNSGFPMTHNWSIKIFEHRVYLPGNYASRPVDYEHLANRLNGDFRYFLYSGSSVTNIEWLYHDRTMNGQRSSYASPPSWLNRLSGDLTESPTFSFETADGSLITFLPMGQNCLAAGSTRCALASTLKRPDGTTYSFAYSGSTLQSVTSNRGYALRFFYGQNASLGPIHVCLVNLATTTMPNVFPCTGSGSQNVSYNLTNGFEVTKPDGNSERIVSGPTVGGEKDISFFRGGESTPWLVNTEQPGIDGVLRQVFANGDTYTYSFERALLAQPPAFAGGSFTAPDGSVTIVNFDQIQMPQANPPQNPNDPFNCERRVDCYETMRPIYQVSSGPTSVVDPLGRTTTMDYCDPQILLLPPNDGGGCMYDLLQSVTDPEGKRTEYTYQLAKQTVVERRRIPKPGAVESPIVETAEYTCAARICYTSMTRFTDANGASTDYEYSTVHGQLLKVTGPPDFNGVRPQKRYTYTQHYAWVLSSGSHVRATVPIWLLASESYCRTSAANASGCAAGASDEVVTTYQYEAGNASTPSNLLLLGVAVTSEGQTLRTCYSYDAFGRRISETQPKANLASCP